MSEPLTNGRLPAEDLPVGEALLLGSHTVTEDEMVTFARQWDPQYFHVDHQAAVASDFGGIIASGIHTAAIFQRLCVDNFFSRYDIIAGREISNLRFLRPVFADTTLNGKVVIDSVEPAGPGRAVFSSTGTLMNEEGQPVLTVVVDALIRARTSGGPREN